MGRWRRVSLGALALLCGGVVFLSVRDWAATGLAEVRAVPTGHREIAWISPATSGDSWERLVAALELLQKDPQGEWRGASPAGAARTLRVNFD
ncbi:MAG TPA: hypothetical protein VNX28_18235, partial [Gemmataceae bacterium]|nr:hypothetical protein [Gemmataceae bacterium]